MKPINLSGKKFITKNLFLIIFFLLFSSICSNTISANRNISRQLMDRMHGFFIETLANNYQGNNEYELYKNFINHYFEHSKSRSTDEINLIIDKRELKEINNDLFKRDFSHFYYFFNDVLYITEKDAERAKKLVENHPDIPIMTIFFEGDINNRPSHLPKFEERHNIYLPLNYGFINDISNNNLKTIASVKEIYEAAGGLHLSLLASIFVNFEGLDELQYKEVRKIISVMFWKYLCLQAGFDFYITIDELEILLDE